MKAPFTIGQTLRYEGHTLRRDEDLYLPKGMVGTVIENREKSPHPTGVPYEAKSVVQFPNGARLFVKQGDPRVVAV